MISSFYKSWIAGGASLSLAWILTACGAPAYQVDVFLSEELQAQYGIYPSLEVDVAAVTENEATRLGTYDVETYFTYQNPMRSTLQPYTAKFSPDQVEMQILKKDNPQWKKWDAKSPVKLFLVVNLPAVPAGDKATDSRRVILPFEPSFWNIFSPTCYFEITPSGIRQVKSLPEKKQKSSAAPSSAAEKEAE